MCGFRGGGGHIFEMLSFVFSDCFRFFFKGNLYNPLTQVDLFGYFKLAVSFRRTEHNPQAPSSNADWTYFAL